MRRETLQEEMLGEEDEKNGCIGLCCLLRYPVESSPKEKIKFINSEIDKGNVTFFRLKLPRIKIENRHYLKEQSLLIKVERDFSPDLIHTLHNEVRCSWIASEVYRGNKGFKIVGFKISVTLVC